MAATYVTHFGLDWPVEFSRTFAAITIAKKWKLLDRDGLKASRSPGDCLEEALRELCPSIRWTPWAQTMVHDFVAHDMYDMIGCGSSGKSHIMSACGLAMWLCDPFDTAVVVGSATLKDLQTRAWAPMVQLFTEVKNNQAGVPIPGKVLNNAYAIVNERDLEQAATMSVRASIQGRALDEGRIQGLHVPWVYLFIDELGLVRDMEALKTTITNIRIGTRGFKCVTAANPEPWESPNSVFYHPPKGVTVTVETGSWTSSTGHFVRHFDGLKSPVLTRPDMQEEWHFLMSKAAIDDALQLCQGDETHPRFFKMIRGFPRPALGTVPTVLDPLVATANKVTLPPDDPMQGERSRYGLTVGVDPAWSETGDEAIYAGCEVILQDGRPLLNFTGRVTQLPLSLKAAVTVTQQLRDGVIARINADGGPALRLMYVDSSGNQGLADALDIYVGPGCGHINSSNRASDVPLRALDTTPACQRVKDRGTEAWFVLAEFCRAGMVRGLPQRAVDALVQRRYMVRGTSMDPMTPLRLEAKEPFIARFKGSPNLTDACALAALAVKERLGILPYGSIPAPVLESVAPTVSQTSGMPPGPSLPEPEYMLDSLEGDEPGAAPD